MGQFKKVFMTKFGYGKGNCLQACVASVFGMRLDDVPDFCEGDADNFVWFHRLEKWCKENNLPSPLLIEECFDSEKNAFRLYMSSGTLFIANGTVNRSDELHCTVWEAQKIKKKLEYVMIHDPFPNPSIDELHCKSVLIFNGQL
jgi:hypothetical protein